jgi:hypothetical protein
MRSPADIRVGVRSQAAIVIGITVLWYLAWLLGNLSGKGFVSNLHLFWVASFIYGPFVATAFSLILLVSHFRAGRPYRTLVYAAVLLSLTPWLVHWMFS